MHIHIGFVQFLVIFFGAVLIPGTIWRLISVHLADTSIGQAMAFMY